MSEATDEHWTDPRDAEIARLNKRLAAQEETIARLINEADHLQQERRELKAEAERLRSARWSVIVAGACECGIAHITVDSIDSGTTVRCKAGHELVFDVWSPEARAKFFGQVAKAGEIEQRYAKLREAVEPFLANARLLCNEETVLGIIRQDDDGFYGYEAGVWRALAQAIEEDESE